MITKQKTQWCCASCGHTQAKWAGQCPSCGEWNSLNEEVNIMGALKRFESQSDLNAKPLRLKEIGLENKPRLKTDIEEFDR